jgi:alkyl hydroperoxide reductase, F subunit
MYLEQNILDQLRTLFAELRHSYTLLVERPAGAKGDELLAMITDFASVSDRLTLEDKASDRLCLTLLRDGQKTGITFRAIPSGHEFTSLILAVLNADGQGRNLPDEAFIARIQALNTPLKLTTYASLTCTNCPEVVQSLNLLALYNEGIEHEMVDGAIYTEEVERLGISSVPAVYMGQELIHVGKATLGELLLALEQRVGSRPTELEGQRRELDLVVVGAGPAGIASAIYSARKGLRVAVVAERIGGQVNETTGIENIPSVVSTTGTQLASDLRRHAEQYGIALLESRQVTSIELVGSTKEVKTSLGETLVAPQVILATGASWRKLGVPGEAEYIGRGVAFCPHCDGPFFKGKDIAVIGGGNSGIEAAIDLAGICRSVVVLEYMDELRADIVLQEKLAQLPNVTVRRGIATREVLGDGKSVVGLRIAPRDGGDEETLRLDGLFVQIGLAANTKPFEGLVEQRRGEIVIDERCRTSVEGIYAAGDCTTVPYKQIVIAMGEGAKAALTAFDERIRSGR